MKHFRLNIEKRVGSLCINAKAFLQQIYEPCLDLSLINLIEWLVGFDRYHFSYYGQCSLGFLFGPRIIDQVAGWPLAVSS